MVREATHVCSHSLLSSRSAAIKQKSDLDYHKQMVFGAPFAYNEPTSCRAPEMGESEQSEAARAPGGEGA